MKKPLKLTIREICILALLADILLLQKEILAFLPNISLTLLLILLFAKCLGFWRTAIIVALYVLLDSLLWGSLNPIFTPAQWLGWILGPLITCRFLRKEERPVPLALWNALFGFLYCWVMIIPTAMTLTDNLDSLDKYLLADLPWELVLALSGFLTTLLLYEPLAKLLRRLWNTTQPQYS